MRIALDATPSAVPLGHGIGVYVRGLISALARITSEKDRFDLSYEARRWHARNTGVPEIDERFVHRRLWPLPFKWGWAANVRVFHALEARLPRARFPKEIVTFHDMYPFHKYLWERSSPEVVSYHTKRLKSYPQIAERVSAIICVSQNTLDDLVRIAPAAADKAVVIPLGTEADIARCLPAEEEVSSSVRQAARGDYFVHIGTMWRIRNLPATVRAFARVAGHHTGLKLVLIGADGEDSAAIHKAVNDAGMAERVLFLGMLSDSEKLFVLARAKALLMFHLYAGFGLPVIEAMALGVPVLASNRGALPEVGEGAGVFVDPQDEDAMSGAMTQLLHDEGLAAALARRGLDRSAALTWDATASATLDIYSRLAEEA